MGTSSIERGLMSGGEAPGGHALYALAHDLDGLEDLVEPDLVPVEDVAVLRVDHVEVDVVVREVRLGSPQVPRETGGAQDRAGRVQGDGLLRRDHARSGSR